MEINEYLYEQIYQNGVIENKNLLANCLSEANEKKVCILDELITQADVDDTALYTFIASLFDLRFVNVSTYNLDSNLTEKVPVSVIKEYRIVPVLIEGDTLRCVTDNIFRSEGLKIVGTYFPEYKVDLTLTTPDNMESLVTNISGRKRRLSATEEFSADAKMNTTKTTGSGTSNVSDFVDSPSIVFADTLLQEAIAANASDIHIEPLENTVRVRFRVDGLLEDHCEMARSLYLAVVARYKILSNLDISERRLPQDGKISRIFNDRTYDFRVSTLPIIYGEKVVIRIFGTLGDEINISKLANDRREEQMFKDILSYPHGIIMFTGPTGSGKSTSLYAFLKYLNKGDVNIQTVEDPVENQIRGINQLQVNTKTGLTFANALRSILRQDPNIIMVGEVRDEETAHIAVRSAITGHLVLSTIHTNDAQGTLPRLIDMGIEPYLVSDALIAAISQRLVRKLCPACKKKHSVTPTESRMTGIPVGTKIFEKKGCPRCNYTGYVGRTAVFEIMVMDESIRNAIDTRNFSSDDYREAVEKNPNFISLQTAGAKLVKDGVTSIEEFETLVSVYETADVDENKGQNTQAESSEGDK